MSNKYVPLEALEKYIRQNSVMAFLSNGADEAVEAVDLGDFRGEIERNTIAFDNDGWCWDMGKALKGVEVLALTEGHIRGCDSKFCIVKYDFCKMRGAMFFDQYGNAVNPIAFRPLPSIPEVK